LPQLFCKRLSAAPKRQAQKLLLNSGQVATKKIAVQG